MEPVQDLVEHLIAIAIEHGEMGVASNTALGQIQGLSFGADGAQLLLMFIDAGAVFFQTEWSCT